MTDQELAIQKGLDALKLLLTVPRTKDAQLNVDPSTIDRSALLIVTQMFTKSGPESGADLLHFVGRLFYGIISELLELNDPITAMKQLHQDLKEDQGAALFTVHPQTLDRIFNSIRIQSADQCLENQTDKLHQLMKKQGTQPKRTLAAIDANYTVYRGKYPNQCHPFAYQGQKDTYKRSFGEMTIFEGPQQFVTKSQVKWNQKSVYKQARLPGWLLNLQNNLAELDNSGITPDVIYGDREFYSGIGMGMAYLGLLSPKLAAADNPRLVVPMKWYGGIEEKWTYLCSSTATQIATETIGVDHYQKDVLEPFRDKLTTNANKTKIEVPIWRVATFDSYVNTNREPRTLDWAHNEALSLQNRIALAEQKLKETEEQYNNFQVEIQRKTIAMPKYKGRRRWNFKNQDEKPLYRACCAAYDALNALQTQKTKLCKRLMFFAVSQRQEEQLEQVTEEISEMVWGYHHRWGIENAFKLLKMTFLIRTHKRGATARHVRRIASILVFNCWQYQRWARAVRKAKKMSSTSQIYKGKYIQNRNFHDVDLAPEGTAEGYLLSLLETGIKSLLKQLFKGVKNT
jgi:hypothetical protein